MKDETLFPDEFEAFAKREGLITESYGLRSVNSAIDVARKAWNAALQSGNSAQPVTVPDGVKKALSDAVAAIYFTDSSDYLSALFAVVKALSPETLELLIANDKATYEATRLPDAPNGV